MKEGLPKAFLESCWILLRYRNKTFNYKADRDSSLLPYICDLMCICQCGGIVPWFKWRLENRGQELVLACHLVEAGPFLFLLLSVFLRLAGLRVSRWVFCLSCCQIVRLSWHLTSWAQPAKLRTPDLQKALQWPIRFLVTSVLLYVLFFLSFIPQNLIKPLSV